MHMYDIDGMHQCKGPTNTLIVYNYFHLQFAAIYHAFIIQIPSCRMSFLSSCACSKSCLTLLQCANSNLTSI